MAKVLIIEDDPYVQALYKRYFEHQKDYDVMLADNGTTGIELAKNQKPSLILLDIMMPGMDGIAVLGSLKSDPDTKHISVMMLTNWGDEKLIREATALGADGFMMKSDFTPDQIHSQIRSYLSDYLKDEEK